MPLTFTDVIPPDPGTKAEEIVGGAAASPVAQGGAAAIAQAKANAVTASPPPNVKAEMSPIAAAGLELAKIVLGMTAGAIALFLIYLFSMELTIGSDVRQAYQEILRPNRVGAEVLAAGQMHRVSAALRELSRNSQLQLPAESTHDAQEVLQLLERVPSLAASDVAQLRDCMAPVTVVDNTRKTKLEACAALLDKVDQAVQRAAGSAAEARTATESMNKVFEQRQGMHTFWVQAAQLVLLNLLLPLLTALFGYIFGTQQASQRPQE